jgi:restriction endonuclease S subunit
MSASPKFQKIDRTDYENVRYKAIMSSVEIFKSSVIRIRDILRGPGVAITGMDSMRHICLYLLSRYMTIEKVKALKVPEDFAWENLIETAQIKNGGVQIAFERFYHAEEDCLVRHFDRLFGTEKFSFDIKNPQKHKEILEILNGVKMEDVDCQMDILGWVYEQHLKTGSSAARDLGQFFTDRFICSYMVKLCSPKFKSPGVPESVCDPSMGTGGFLTAYIKYFKETYPEKSIDWAVQQKEIHGCDTDPKVAGVSRLNLFMESGGCRFENLLTHDSLYGDLPLTGYDVILANMPFGLKGIVHASCCERVKNLRDNGNRIDGTKSEPLFLQLMMVSLKLGGRCAVVVPDGVLVNTSKLHNGTRKYLLDNYNLKRVIKMNGQFFMNTTIKPTILFFENTGKATESVEFWDVVADTKGAITESMILSVPRAKFDSTSSFDLRRYQESEKPMANPSGFPMVKLGEIVSFVNGYAFKSEEFKHEGIPVVKITTIKNNIITFEKADYVNRNSKLSPYIVKKGEIVVALSGATLGIVGRNTSGTECYLNQRVAKLTITSDKVNSNYVYYYMITSDFIEKVRGLAGGSAQPNVSTKNIEDLTLPLPPLEIQNQIVATLDRIYAPGTTELTDTLKMTDRTMDLVLANPTGVTLEPIVEAQRLIRKSAQMVADVKAQMVADVKAQMVAIMKSVESRGFPKTKLSDLCNDMSTNKNIPSSERRDGEFRFFTCSRDYSTHNEFHYKGSYLIHGSRGSTIGESVFITLDEKFAIGTSMFMSQVKDASKVDLQYLYYYLKCNKEIVDARVNSSAIPMISKTVYYTIEISVPPIEFQKVVVKYLNDLQSQLTSLESLQKQSERNAKFILDSYLNTTQ